MPFLPQDFSCIKKKGTYRKNGSGWGISGRKIMERKGSITQTSMDLNICTTKRLNCTCTKCQCKPSRMQTSVTQRASAFGFEYFINHLSGCQQGGQSLARTLEGLLGHYSIRHTKLWGGFLLGSPFGPFTIKFPLLVVAYWNPKFEKFKIQRLDTRIRVLDFLMNPTFHHRFLQLFFF